MDMILNMMKIPNLILECNETQHPHLRSNQMCADLEKKDYHEEMSPLAIGLSMQMIEPAKIFHNTKYLTTSDTFYSLG